jgi:aminoglycoside phosphotransferase (APT) family kinase protein
MTPAPTSAALLDALHRLELVPRGAEVAVTPLEGGVSSDIARIDVGGRSFCVKQALPKLKVAADWRAPVSRNHSEAEWIRVAGEIVPDAVPRLIGEDRAAGLFAMAWLAPEEHPVWKAELRDGRIEPAVALEVGRRIALVHAATAGRVDVSTRFANDVIFHQIRIEPYLLAAAERHADCANALRRLAETTAQTKLALVHGDVSPKNILIGPRGPIFLDAECAWYGDPAFDLAFLLNHLLLKCVWRPQWRARYLAAFRAATEAYLSGVAWEPRDVFEGRAAWLLPGLTLARVDGKSPVEYVSEEADRERIRACAKPLLLAPRTRLGEVAEAWRQAMERA